VRPAEWHSQLYAAAARAQPGGGRRRRGERRSWRAFGVVSATADLGLIVVDEEHDQAYKQEDGARYHARDMAVVRARAAAIPIVLAPRRRRVETEVNARARTLPAAAPAGALRRRRACRRLKRLTSSARARRAGATSLPRLAEAVQTAVERGEQALLFLNRRGYAPLTLCRQCGFRLACPNCDAWLVTHRFRRKLVCHHHCGICECQHRRSAQPPGHRELCRLRPPASSGLEEEVAAGCFPGKRVTCSRAHLVATMDRMRDELTRSSRALSTSSIGTQLVAKGHHFPKLNLCRIVDGRPRPCQRRPRAAERTFQLLHQVVGPRRTRGRAAASATCRRTSPSTR